MATLEDLQDVLTSVKDYSVQQAKLLKDIFDVNHAQLERQRMREEREDADRTTPPPLPGPLPGPAGDPTPPDLDPGSQNGPGLFAAVFGGTFIADMLSKVMLPFKSSLKQVFGLVATLGKTFLKIVAKCGALYLLYSLFKDIGDNPRFSQALENVRAVWNEKVLPVFDNLRALFERLTGMENVGGVIEMGFNIFGNFKDSVQNFAIDTINTLATAFSDLFTGIDQMISGDIIGGIKTILFGAFKAIGSTIDSLVTRFIQIFKADFAGDGTVMSVITEKILALTAYVGEIWRNMIDGIKSKLNSIVEFFAPIADGISAAFTGFKLAFDVAMAGLSEMFTNTIDWVKQLFSDPTEALKTLWEGLVGQGGILDIIWMPYNKAIDFVMKKFGWSEADAPEFNLLAYIKEAFSKISTIVSSTFESVMEWLSNFPTKIRLIAESKLNDMSERIGLGFIDVAEWLSAIPKKMLAMVLDMLGAISFKVPDWVPRIGGKEIRLVDQDDVAEANKAAAASDPYFDDMRAGLIASTEATRKTLELEMSKLNEVALAASTQKPTVNIQNTDNRVMQTTNSGRNSSNIINSIGGRNDLDVYTIPGTAM